MLRYCGEPLIKWMLYAAMVSAHHELPRPQIRSPVTYGLNQPDEFTLVRRELGVLLGNGTTEECNRPLTLMVDRTKARPRGVAIDYERLLEVR